MLQHQLNPRLTVGYALCLCALIVSRTLCSAWQTAAPQMTAAPLVQETDGEAVAVAVCSKFVCASVYVRAFVSNVSLHVSRLVQV